MAGLLPGHLNNEDPCSGRQSINLVSDVISFRQAPAGTLDLASARTRDTRVAEQRAERAEDRGLLVRTKKYRFLYLLLRQQQIFTIILQPWW